MKGKGRSADRDGRKAGRLLAGRLILLLGSVTIGLIIAEITVRLIGHAPDLIPIGTTSDRHVYRRSTNPILSYEFKPGFRSDEENLAFDYRVINSHGLRDIERSYTKPPGTKRIILLGDSVVVGYGITKINQLMSRQLEMLYGDQNVEVINMGMTGYCTLAEIEWLRVQGLKYDPDAVILVFVENDFRNFNPESVGADGMANRPRMINWLFNTCHVFRLACVKLNWFGLGLETNPADWNQKAIGDNNVVDGLALFRKLTDQYGFEPLVAVWPGFTSDRIEYPEQMFIPGSKELIIKRLARIYDLPVVGLRDSFQTHFESQHPRPIPRKYYTIGDGMHPSTEGHRVTAGILHTIMEEQLLPEPDEVQTARTGPGSTPDSEAIQAAKALGQEKAHNGLVYYNKAVDLYQEAKFDEAIEQLERIHPSDALCYGDASVMLASILIRQGKTEKAKARLVKTIQHNPDHFQAHMLIADLLKSQTHYEQAIQHLKHAIALVPEKYEGHYFLGLALGQRGQWKEARPHMQRAAQLAPNLVQVSNGLGAVLANLKYREQAIRQFRHSLRLDPSNVQAHKSLQVLQSSSP